MAQQLEEGNTNNYGSEANTSSTDELAEVSALNRGAVEVMVIQTLQRLIMPMFEPLIRRVVKEETGLAQQKLLASMKVNPANNASTSVPKKLKLQFRNKISLPVFTGKDLLGENQKPIEIVLVDALTGQIVNTGTESTAKLEIVVLQAGDDEGDDDSWTFEEFQERIVGEKKGKRILQGNNCLHLKEGIGFVGKISFTHSAEWTKKGWYRLGARVVDAALMTGVEVARTEAFLMKDWRTTLYEKHYPPSLLDKVYHLEQISYKGAYYKRLRGAKVDTVQDFLTRLYTNPKQLEDILKLKASCKIWDDIVNHAQTSDGMFLYLDPSYERKTGVVLDVKLQLKGLIVESHQYIPVDQPSDKQKADNQSLVKFASEHLELLDSFKDEASLKEFLESDNAAISSLPSVNQSLGTSNILDGPPSPSSQVTYSYLDLIEAPDNLDNSNLHMDQSLNQEPMVTSQSERGKETVSFETDMTYSVNYYQQDISFHSFRQLILESPNELGFGTPTERHAYDPTQPGTSSQAVKSPLNTCGHTNNFNNLFRQSPDCPIYTPDFNLDENLCHCPNYDFNSPNNERHSEPANSDTDVVIVAAQTVSVCTSAQTRWTKVSKLLRRLSVRERIRPPEGVRAQKKQRCC